MNITIKQDFRNGNFVFCVWGNEISLEFIPKNLFYDYTSLLSILVKFLTFSNNNIFGFFLLIIDNSLSYIAIKQDFRNGNFVFCVWGNEISLEFIPKNLFYDYILLLSSSIPNFLPTLLNGWHGNPAHIISW